MSLQTHSHASPVNNGAADNDLETRGICLLSLDGGGVRGLSTLYILRALMQRLNDERRGAKLGPVKPCDVFDLIGGTSTGGLIAIMLGRLEMDVDECIEAYKGLMKTVFEKKETRFRFGFRGEIKSKFSSKVLEEAIKSVIKNREVTGRRLAVDEPLLVSCEGEDLPKCKVFVCSKSTEINYVTLLKSYRLKGGHAEKTTIWEAALATSAAPSFFDPVRIDDRVYVDGALGANNPAKHVEKEARRIWCEATGDLRPLLKCFISIGTGNQTINPISDKAWKFLTESLKAVATDTRATEDEVAATWMGHKRYFRFNVLNGLQEVGLEEYKYTGLINAATLEYVDNAETQPRIRSCVAILRMKKYPATQKLCDDQTEARAEEESGQEPNTKTLTVTEISELMDRANAKLKKPRSTITYTDLTEAYNDFAQVLGAKRDQTPCVPAKELAYVYNKLSSTGLLLSHFLNFTPKQRMAYVHNAVKCATRALESAVLSGNNDRVVQMQFYLSCAEAREIQLRCEDAQFGHPTVSERDASSDKVKIAWGKLRSVERLDYSVYDAMAQESLCQLSKPVTFRV